ncbi:EamA family transporter RarD [Jatrophihabitans telluris]|uniref:EamA family transporter RarD n=1 Tax=Jatrophihabitans telluris TaxID=2038343 RepID=A0ABY4QXQ6_9ACTN|nr:EamA family transporter RarD [Jatrophihabitans telluris]UQX88052.1 EamA family transporter RarD [Jatrophihabitans telluris]
MAEPTVTDLAIAPETAAERHRDGLTYGVAAYLLWGLFPLYWPLLKPAGALEILAQRMVWSLVFVAVLILVRHRVAAVRAALAQPGVVWRLAVGALFVSVNWGVYIWGVNHGHVVETSLGYFINPLLTILLGVIVLKETLRPMQWCAVGVASAAIVVLTIDFGRLPWIALVLAFSFASYGFVKSRTGVGAIESLAIETGVLFVPAVITLSVIGTTSQLQFGHHGVVNTLLLMGTGVVTAVPLLLFAAGARRLPLSVLGLLQYLAPVLQLAVGVGIRHEPLPPARLAGFALVWLALIMLTVDALRASRRTPAA